MKEWKTITPEEITTNPFRLIGKEWMLVTAEMNGKANTMTASWGGVGVLWNKPGRIRIPAPAALHQRVCGQLRHPFLKLLRRERRGAIRR